LRVASAVPRVLLAGLGFLVLTLFTQSAKADTIDFSCGGSQTCTGTVVQSGSNYSSMGIGLTSSFDTNLYTLTFDTSTDTITITENGTSTAFVGTITGLTTSDSGGLTVLDFGVDWTTFPSGSYGTEGSTPSPAGSVVSISISGNALSVDIPIVAPEPSVPVLLSAGLIALGLLLKHRAAALA